MARPGSRTRTIGFSGNNNDTAEPTAHHIANHAAAMSTLYSRLKIWSRPVPVKIGSRDW
jgi:hypothetical protein